MRMQVRSLASLRGVKHPALLWAVVQVADAARIWHCCVCGRCSSNSTPSLGTSICLGCGPKKKNILHNHNTTITVSRLSLITFLLHNPQIQILSLALVPSFIAEGFSIESKCLGFFFCFFFFNGYTSSTWKFLGQGLNPRNCGSMGIL